MRVAHWTWRYPTKGNVVKTGATQKRYFMEKKRLCLFVPKFTLRARLAPIIWGCNQKNLFMILTVTCLAATELVMEFISNSMVFLSHA
jgi:hypothetical protein